MEQKWLVRIIFNDLKVGISYTQILDRFYPRALERYNECLSLKLVCEEEGICSELSGLQLFTGYSPMLPPLSSRTVPAGGKGDGGQPIPHGGEAGRREDVHPCGHVPRQSQDVHQEWKRLLRHLQVAGGERVE